MIHTKYGESSVDLDETAMFGIISNDDFYAGLTVKLW